MFQFVNSGPLSFQQKQNYDYHISLTDEQASEIMLLEIDVSDLKSEYCIKAIDFIFKECDSLRTIIDAGEKSIVQKVVKYDEETAPYLETVYYTSHVLQHETVDNLFKKISRQINLSGDSLLCRCFLVNFQNDAIKCVFFVHHIIADLWSLQLIRKRFFDLYQCLTENHPISSISQYNLIDYAIEQRNTYQLKGAATATYWRLKLAQVLTETNPNFVDITASLSFTPVESTNKGWITNRLDTESCGFIALKVEGDNLTNIYEVLKNTNTGFLALFNAVISLLPFYFGNDKQVLIASPINNRINSKLKNLIGSCGGAIYNYHVIDDKQTVGDLIKELYFSTLKSIKHIITDHDIIELDGKLLREKCDVFLNITSKDFKNEIPEQYYTGEAFEGKCTYYALQCAVHEQEDHICMIWGYNNFFYTAAHIQSISDAFFDLIAQFNYALETPIMSLRRSKSSFNSDF